MGNVAAEDVVCQQEYRQSSNNRSWLKWGVVFLVWFGSYLYFSQSRNRQAVVLQELEPKETWSPYRALEETREENTVQHLDVATLIGTAEEPQEETPIPPEPAANPVAPQSVPAASKININTATFEVLDSLPGVGSVTARAIVAYREANGGFKKLKELRKVKGIGKQKFRWLEGLVTV